MNWFSEDSPPAPRRVGDPLFSYYHAMTCGHLQRESGVLKHKGRVVIPSHLVPLVLHESHDSKFGAHCGVFRLIQNLSLRVWWASLDSDVQDWVASCSVCLCRKPPNRPVRTHMKPIFPTGPFETLCCDHMGPITTRSGEKKWLLVLICQATRW